MTPTTKPVKRLSSDTYRGRQIVVIVGPGPMMGFRLKGTRTTYETTVEACMQMAAKQMAERKRIDKLKAAGKWPPKRR